MLISAFVEGVGAQWSNFFESGSGAPNDVSLGDVAFMFIIDSILYSLITWYVGSIAPGEFGVAQPWYFIFSRDYWQPNAKRAREAHPGIKSVFISLSLAHAVLSTDWDSDSDQGRNFERPLSKTLGEGNIGVFIRDLTKTYKGVLGRKEVKAVRGVSLDLYKGEITALLGHNGAGKTTTMSILTGT